MTTSAAAELPLAPEKPRGASVALSPWRCPLEKQPWVHAFVQTIPGKVVLLLAFTAIMIVTRVSVWKETAVALTFLTFLPQYRRQILAVLALAWIFIVPPLIKDEQGVVFGNILLQHGALHLHHLGMVGIFAAAVIAFGLGFVWFVRRFPKSPIGQRPVTSLLILLFALLAILGPLHGVAWYIVAMFTVILGKYVWFISYTLAEPKQQGKHPPVRIGYWRYFWAMNPCPMGKGASYLDRVEAKDAATLATVQLKGLKLIFWAAVLSIFRVLFTNVLFGPLSESKTRIPFWDAPGLILPYPMALDAFVAGNPLAWHLRWLALISFFLCNILELSIWGHKLIAVARMAGFNAFRMTYRPLTATSIAEFFNRIHWYLKEMLATFFFYPTYLRYFKKHPRLRVFAATMASACFGNFVYHLVAYDRHLFERGLWESIKSYHHYAIYTLILGVGIGISQMHIIGKKKTTPTGIRKVMAIAGVLFFYCILSNFDNEVRRDLGFVHYWGYFLSLFKPW